jgi:hypothetical protein
MDPAFTKRAHDFLDFVSSRLAEERRANDDSEDSERDITNPLEAPPSAPFSDSPPEMPKEPLWGGKPPIPIAHL